MLVAWISNLRTNAEDWSRGRRWPARAVLLSYLVYAGIRHLSDPVYRSWFAGITLVFHEIGHLVFAGLGRTANLLGGSVMQLLVPAAAGTHLLLRQGDWFGTSVCGAWLGFSTWELATYIDDANRQLLPLVGFGDNPEHDWGALLTQWHLLNASQAIASATRTAALLVWALSVALGAWLCLQMRSARRP